MSLWTEQDLPVLRAIHDMSEEVGHPRMFEDEKISERSGVSLDRCRRAIDRLSNERYIRSGMSGENRIGGSVSNEALRALREWPTGNELAAVLPAILLALGDKEHDSKKQSAFTKAAELVESLGVEVAAATISRVMLGV